MMVHNAQILWWHFGDRESPKKPPYPCLACGALVTLRQDPTTPRWIVQHGANPEAILYLHLRCGEPFLAEQQRMREEIAAWAARVHAYEREDGALL